jgi:general secretion pathway protein M
MQQFRAQASATWAGMAARERSLVAMAALVVALALLWWVGIAPALATLRSAEAQRRVLDTQLQNMRALAAQAQALQALPRSKPDESLIALESSVKQYLGPGGTLSVVGERATVALKGVSGGALALWLGAARSNARALPVEARLVLNIARTGWDGSVVLALPAP